MPSVKIAQVATSDISIRFLLLDHIRALRDMGHEVIAVCSPGPWVEEVRGNGLRVETVPMSREPNPAGDARALLGLVGCFRRNRFDVVHTHTPKAGLIGPLAARMAGVPAIVHTIHGLLFHDAQPKSRQRLCWLPEKFTASLSHHLLSQSKEDIATCVRRVICAPQKISYIGNGIDTEEFRPCGEIRKSARTALGFGENEFVFGSVGRLVAEKGFEELFSAAEEIRTEFPAARLLVVGPEEHDQRDAIAPGRVHDLENRGIVVFAGMQTETKRYYSAMDAFVLPSHREGLPRACMEAAASGLPVIASDIRGCREVVVSGETGLLVPMQDHRALCDAMKQLVADRKLVRSMGEKGRQRITAYFDQRQVIDRLRDFYRRLEAEHFQK